ncbi:hypothetical protein [Coleofasciculus sp. G2-EDA-02]|uniref:hypothetical protein n=1 Tax=Coleofasciculus sp. G2-EDA-02 TaxID=3069529 RepID=UPI0032F704A2
MGNRYIKQLSALAIATTLIIGSAPKPIMAQQRNAVAHPRTPYRLSFYNRHRRSYRVASALHFAHSKLHDVLLLTPFQRHGEEDTKLYQEVLAFYQNPPRIEPTMELYAPYTARATWRLFRTIDSVHLLHEMTEDIMADSDIPWNEKEQVLKEAYDYYKSTYKDIALSPAPLDVTMRRAGVMMKPYFSLTRNYYPKNNNFFYAAHWWHPAIYESMMIGGNDQEQDKMIQKMEDLFSSQVVPNPPMRMILSREGSPRYSRLSPETANVFDNLHMLHGITYDIFAYDGWTIEQKRAELNRVLDAMSYQPGDEKLVRKFTTPKPDLNPLVYDDWIKSSDGAMAQMMMEMLAEMMPMMMQHHGGMDSQMDHSEMDSQMDHSQMDSHGHHGEMSPQMHQMHQQLMAQLKLKLTPGIQSGEMPGSFMDAMMEIMPNMPMSPEMMAPGKVNPMMIEAMLKGWQEKYGNLPDVEPIPMGSEPSAQTFLE